MIFDTTDFHTTDEQVIITDVDGINDAFFFLKDTLKNQSCGFVYFIYFTSNNTLPLFRYELKYLAHRYPSKLSIDFIKHTPDTIDNCDKIEAALNSKIANNIFFKIIGNSGFVEFILGHLRFLDVNKNQIATETLK